MSTEVDLVPVVVSRIFVLLRIRRLMAIKHILLELCLGGNFLWHGLGMEVLGIWS